MSSKVKYIAMPSAQRSQFVDTLGSIISQNSADRRYEQQSLKDDRRFQLQLARQNRQDALAAARQSLADKRYNDSIAYRNQRDAKADQEKVDLLKASIAEASADPINVDYSTEKTGVFDVVGQNGQPVMQDEYDTQKITDLLAKDPNAFEEKTVDVIPLNQINNKNKWAAETIKRIELDPRYDNNEQRTKALKDAMVKAGYGDIVNNEDEGIISAGKSVLGGLNYGVNKTIEGLNSARNFMTGGSMKDILADDKRRTKEESEYWKPVSSIDKIKEMAKKYEGTLVKNKNIKTFNDRLKQAEKDRIAKLYQDLKTGNKVKKTKVDTKRTERTQKEILADIRAKAAKEVKKVDAMKNLSLTEKAGYIRGILKAKNEALSKYSKIKQDAQDFKQWNVKESIKSGYKKSEKRDSIRLNLMAEEEKNTKIKYKRIVNG